MKRPQTIKELLKGCEHDGSYIPVNEVERLIVKSNKQWVTFALQIQAERARVHESEPMFGEIEYSVDKSSITDFNLDQIK